MDMSGRLGAAGRALAAEDAGVLAGAQAYGQFSN